jgi:hypothetical protein
MASMASRQPCAARSIRLSYQRLEIVAYNKGSFIARNDDPGPCPGDGWQLITAHGARGEKGAQGPRGEQERATLVREP